MGRTGGVCPLRSLAMKLNRECGSAGGSFDPDELTYGMN